MAGKTAGKTPAAEGTGYDLTTGIGFMTAFDSEVSALARSKRWCSSWRSTAYSQAGIPDPDRRSATPADQILAVLKFVELNDAGKAELAKRAAEHDAKLAEYKAGVRRCAVYGLESGQVTLADVNGILTRLGMTNLQSSNAHPGSTGGNVYFQTNRMLTDTEREAVSAAVGTAVKAAVEGAMPEGVAFRDVTSGDTPFYTGSDRHTSGTFEDVPADAK